jgi:alcohol dehydrogenase
MKEFSLTLPRRIIYGRGIISKIAEIAEFGRRCVIFAGRRFAESSGLLGSVRKYLKTAGVDVEVFRGIEPEPDLEQLQGAIDFCKGKKPDVVVGIGGGSVLDVAKAAAALMNEDGAPREYQSGRKIIKRGAPFVAVPTTCGSGAEATYNSVILDREKCAKRSIRDFKMMAQLVIVDTELVLSLPRETLSVCAADALCHAIEGYISKNANPFTDTLAEEAIRIIAFSLQKAVHNEDKDAKQSLCFASLLGGVVLANAGLGACHGLAASIGAITGASHGLVCAILLPSTLRFNADVCAPKLKKIASFFESSDAIKAVERLFCSVGIPKNLGSVGLRRENLKSAAENVSSSVRHNPKEATFSDLLWIMENTL